MAVSEKSWLVGLSENNTPCSGAVFFSKRAAAGVISAGSIQVPPRHFLALPVRSTYFLAGQAVATRISGDPDPDKTASSSSTATT